MTTLSVLILIGLWLFIGFITAIINSWNNKLELEYSILILSCIVGLFSTIITIWYYCRDNNKFPKWMYKNIIEYIK